MVCKRVVDLRKISENSNSLRRNSFRRNPQRSLRDSLPSPMLNRATKISEAVMNPSDAMPYSVGNWTSRMQKDKQIVCARQLPSVPRNDPPQIAIGPRITLARAWRGVILWDDNDSGFKDKQIFDCLIFGKIPFFYTLPLDSEILKLWTQLPWRSTHNANFFAFFVFFCVALMGGNTQIIPSPYKTFLGNQNPRGILHWGSHGSVSDKRGVWNGCRISGMVVWSKNTTSFVWWCCCWCKMDCLTCVHPDAFSRYIGIFCRYYKCEEHVTEFDPSITFGESN